MKFTSKWFLVSVFLLFTMEAMAQTITNEQAAAAQANPPASSAAAGAAQVDRPATFFMVRSQSQGLQDRAFVMGVSASLAPTHTVSATGQFCPGPEGQPDGVCTGGLVCCDCIGDSFRCVSVAECKRECIE